MKNLTRVLALVLVFAMALSTVAFAAFTDVKEADDYAEAIDTLAALGIIKGYEDGTFGADKAITRAEAVAIVNRIQNLAQAAAGASSASLYTDVAANHWALGDINLATQMGTVSGDGDGKFRPEDQVSYQEMVKMLVCALGYAPAVAEKGGWPTGYLIMAQENGILDDTVNGGATPATRGVVAQLTFNALTAPMMEQTGYGTNREYTLKDKVGEKKTLLDSKLSIYKVDATPVANDVTSIAGGSPEDVGYVKLDIATESSKAYDAEAFYDVAPPFKATQDTFLVGNSEIGATLGYQVIAYIQKNDDKEWEVLYSEYDPEANTVVELDPEFITVSGDTITYEDEDNDIDEDYDVDSSTKYVVDGKYVEGQALVQSLFEYSASEAIEGTVKLIYHGKNDYASYVFVDKYITDVVEEVSTNGKTIMLKNGSPIRLDTKENKNLVYTLTLEGKAIEPSELKENDVISYKTSGKDYYEIVVCRDTVEGTITATGTKNSVAYYNIGGKEYNASKSYVGLSTLTNSLKLDKTGVFFLDVYGKIAHFEKTATGATGAAYNNLAYVIEVGKGQSGLSETLKAKMLTAKGEVKTFDFASSATLYKNTLDAGKVEHEQVEGLKAISGSSVSAEYLAALNSYAKGNLVDYKVNTSGEITEITVWADPSTDSKYEAEEFAYAGNVASATFSERQSKLDKYVIGDDTVVFYVPSDDEDEMAVSDSKFFADEETYEKLSFYCVDSTTDAGRIAGAIVVKAETEAQAKKQNLAVFFSESSTMNEEGTTVTAVTFWQNGKKQTVNCETATKVGYDVGATFTYTTNASGEIKKIEPQPAAGYEKEYYAYQDNETGAWYTIGQVVGRSGSDLTLALIKGSEPTADERDVHKVSSDANIYLVDYSKKNTKVEAISTISEITKNVFEKVEGKTDKQLAAKEDADNFIVIMRYYKDDVTDVVVFKNFAQTAADMDAISVKTK